MKKPKSSYASRSNLYSRIGQKKDLVYLRNWSTRYDVFEVGTQRCAWVLKERKGGVRILERRQRGSMSAYSCLV